MAPLQGNPARMIHRDALEDTDNVRAVAFATYHCGITPITEANRAQLWERYVALNLAFGHPPTELRLTPQIIERFVGYATNASLKSTAQFHRYLLAILDRRTKDAVAALARKPVGV